MENVQEESLDKKWFNQLTRIKLKGFTKTLAYNSHLLNESDESYEIQLNDDAKKILELDPQSLAKLQSAISQYLNNPSFRLDIKNLPSINANSNSKSPAEIKRENAIEKIHNDQNVKLIRESLAIEIMDNDIILTN
nr:DNA polymerase III subunit gamma/tau C-terminal domain-containing protein [Francisella salimarina]